MCNDGSGISRGGGGVCRGKSVTYYLALFWPKLYEDERNGLTGGLNDVLDPPLMIYSWQKNILSMLLHL